MKAKKIANISVRISEDIKSAISLIATKEDRSVSQQVERCLKLALASYADKYPELKKYKHLFLDIP